MKRELSIIGVPMDLGQAHRGVAMGPSAMRYAGLMERLEKLNYKVYDVGNIEVPSRSQQATLTENGKTLRHLEAVVEVNERLAKKVAEQVTLGRFPLILGGDHSIAIGSLAGVSKYYQNLGVIWYDAHGDINTHETTSSGNIHGMPLAASLGYGHQKLTSVLFKGPKVKREQVVLIGVRDLDLPEKELLKKLSIKTFTMHEVDRLGMSRVMEEAIDYLAETDGVHVSFDMDVINPSEAPGVGTPVMGGLTYRESHLALEMLAEAKLVTSPEFVEVNPMLDERNKTANLAVALASSLLGEKLL